MPQRVTKEQVLGRIVDEQYKVWPGTNLTTCVLTLDNRFTVSGEAGCVDPDLFDAKKGQELAYERAVNEIWKLEGYLLAEKMYGKGLQEEEHRVT